MSAVKPYTADGSKREQVERMFDSISPKYDLLNRLLSFGTDQGWRRKVMRSVGQENVRELLDVATGTADLAIMAAKQVDRVTGADISEGMLGFGREKVKKAGLSSRVELVRGDAADLPFADNRFDAITVAFGVRNFEDLDRGVRGMLRVLKPNGRLFVLEFSKPHGWMRPFFHFYFHRIMPAIGRLVSKDSAAYTYLPASVDAFPEGPAFVAILRNCGGREVTSRSLTGGIATLYIARK
ncbi:MAG: bifunctional demethylmenaquinone methyltransferase/2-methoxy-6-polyprenyl-1,4-benzoquinol methylase UbiE [Flavobacteriales bacterium]|nr:bifunctional demethylmenaquinone methyltransferase/2-methoxy-6-polyprenyl-1,4-benzoquinol methylase UbiE [Flavobacteriales bacterium]